MLAVMGEDYGADPIAMALQRLEAGPLGGIPDLDGSVI